MTVNSIDISLICLNTMGVVLLISYLVFAYLVTHRGNFYHARRWKAAVWFTTIFGVILSLFFVFFQLQELSAMQQGKTTYEFIGQVIGAVFWTLTFITPLLFVITIGTHHQLKWWLNSDDYLEKIWKTSNKGHKSPIEEL